MTATIPTSTNSEAAMGTEVAARPGGALALSTGQTDWTPDQLAVVRQIGLQQASHEELRVFLHVCQTTGLDPFAKQIYGIMRNVWNPQTQRKEPRLTIQTGIDGFRLVASRKNRVTGEPSGFQGRVGPYWCGPDGQWSDVWLNEGPPYAAKVGVWKEGYREPIWAVCLYREYVQTDAKGQPNQFWRGLPSVMLAKAAEASALRAAFPMDLSGVYAPEEMERVAAEELAARTVEGGVDAVPPRSPEEQALWDRMTAVDAAIPGAESLEALSKLYDELMATYNEAAKAGHDNLVAAIKATGLRLRAAQVKLQAIEDAKAAADAKAEQDMEAVLEAELAEGSGQTVDGTVDPEPEGQ